MTRSPSSQSHDVPDAGGKPATSHGAVPLPGCLIHSEMSADGLSWLSKTLRCVPDITPPPADTFRQFEATFRVATFDEVDVCMKILGHVLGLSPIGSIGLRELLANAVEHGNLGISFDEKTDLLKTGMWQQEIERRLASARYREKFASVSVRRTDEIFTVDIVDQGAGFDWQGYLDGEENPSTLLHGRGVSLAMGAGFDKVEYRGTGNEVHVCGAAG